MEAGADFIKRARQGATGRHDAGHLVSLRHPGLFFETGIRIGMNRQGHPQFQQAWLTS